MARKNRKSVEEYTERRRKKSAAENIVGILFVVLLFSVAIINLLVPDQEKSNVENRMLTMMPKLTQSNLMSGEFMEQFESYLSDQFVGRNLLRKWKIKLDYFSGTRLENGVLIGEDGQLLEEIEVPNSESLSNSLDGIKSFSEKHPDLPVYMLLVPDSASVLDHCLPAYAQVENQTQMISMVKKSLGDSVTWIDAVSSLEKHKFDRIYYKTDHHWTSLGAYYVFRDAAPLLGIEDDFSSRFASYTVSDQFNGSLASKCGYGLSEKETVEIYVPTGIDNDVIVNYVDEGYRTTSIYDSSKLDGTNQYEVFMGGNFSVVDIKTMSTRQNRLLLFKDSFADCFVQFLTPYYREIVVVDPRYYSGTEKELMETYQITDVMYLYRGNTFFADNNLSGVLKSE